MVCANRLSRMLHATNLIPDAIRSRPIIIIPADNDLSARKAATKIALFTDRATFLNVNIADVIAYQV